MAGSLRVAVPVPLLTPNLPDYCIEPFQLAPGAAGANFSATPFMQ